MSDVGIGAVLRDSREQQQRTLEEAAAASSMRMAQVEAMEADRFEVFGGDVYAKGFLRSYATWLGLDPEPLLDRYRRYVQHDRHDALTIAPSGVARPDATNDFPMWLVRGVAAIGVVALGAGLVQLVNSRAPAPADEPTVAVAPDPVRTSPTDEAPSATPSTPAPSPTPRFEGVELTLAFEGRSWVSVTVDGESTQEGLFESGDVLDLTGDDEVVVRFGDASVVSALLNGERYGPFGTKGQVLNVRFTPDGVDET